MLDQPLRGLILTAVAVAVGCSAADDPRTPGPLPDDPLERYVVDAAFRRSALEGSLVRRDNGYAALRLAEYTEDRWGALPEWNPDGLDADAADLRALGEQAFFSYPMQIAPRGGGPFMVTATMRDGTRAPAFTCATCHAADGVPGRNAATLDVAALVGAGAASWRPGTVDVTDDGVDNPVSIPDLRPVRFQTHLHHAATVENGLVPLAIRIETLIITSMSQSVRPPRRVAAGLAAYLWSLGEDRAATPASPAPAVFGSTCARCHGGPPVPMSLVGTDPAVGLSTERGTGTWRVPSLHFAGDRHRLFASGAAEDLEDVLSPSRVAPGHDFGRSLADDERRALIDYVRTL